MFRLQVSHIWNLLLPFAIGVVLAPGITLGESKNLSDFSPQSSFLRVILDEAINKKEAASIQSSYRRNPRSFKIWGSINPKCPTWYQWDNEQGSQSNAQNSLKAAIRRELKGFPKSTLKKCTEVSAIFADGQPTSHWRNKKMFWTNVIAIAIKDLRSNEITLTRALSSSNISNNIRKKEAHLYNENLELVCSFRNIDMKNLKASADCGGLGSGRVIGERKGSTTVFTVVTPKAAIFATTDMSLEQAKRSFPEIFK